MSKNDLKLIYNFQTNFKVFVNSKVNRNWGKVTVKSQSEPVDVKLVLSDAWMELIVFWAQMKAENM